MFFKIIQKISKIEDESKRLKHQLANKENELKNTIQQAGSKCAELDNEISALKRIVK
jgi:hypothetical protein